jgi:hypothetical protein
VSTSRDGYEGKAPSRITTRLENSWRISFSSEE